MPGSMAAANKRDRRVNAARAPTRNRAHLLASVAPGANPLATHHDIFLAHAGPDTAPAKALHAALKALGRQPFLDAIDLLPGDDWDLLLPRALHAAQACVILIGGTFDAAHYLRDEVATAIALARADATRHRVIPVYLHGAPTRVDQVPYGLRVKNYLDWPALGGATGVAVKLNDLFGALAAAPALGATPAPTLAELPREARYDALITLLPAQFAELLFRAGAPAHELPPDTQPLGLRALSLVQWLDTQTLEKRLAFDQRLREKAPGRFV